MKPTVKLVLLVAASILLGASFGNAANVQPLNPPPADVADPLYAVPLAALLPASRATLPAVDPAVLAVWSAAKASVMPVRAAARPLMPKIAPIVGGNVMAHVMNVMMTSLSDPTNTTGVPVKMAPF